MMSKIGRKLTAEECRKHQQYRNMVNDRMPKSKTLIGNIQISGQYLNIERRRCTLDARENVP